MDENEDKLVEIDLTPEKPDTPDRKDDIDVIISDDPAAISRADDDDESDPFKAIEKLKKKLKKEKEARREAETRAAQAAFQAKKATVEVEDTHRHLVSNAIETIKRDNESLTATYAEAMRSGDYEAGARIQSLINQNDLNLKQLEEGHIQMQQEAKTRPADPPPPPAPMKPKEQIDSIIDQVSKPSAQWLKANRDRFTDEKDINKMFRAHGDAVDEGIEPDTQEYFSYIENRLGFNRRNDGDSPMSSASKPVSRQAPPPSAPVNRDGGNQRNVVRLTSAEMDHAKAWGWDEKEYAINKAKLQKEGRLPN
jgi:hypothetical protein